VEKEATLGGTCLNIGCIPSKALLNISDIYKRCKQEYSSFGIGGLSPVISVSKLMQKKDEVVSSLTKGVDYLFKKNKVARFQGSATLLDGSTVKVAMLDGNSQLISAKNIVLATGSVPIGMEGVEIDEKTIVTSTGALSLQAVPKTMVVVGAGIIGLELGSVWSRFGASVEFVELANQVGSTMDQSLSYTTHVGS
jgi:dihydrolipoamide dehydrogenase